MGEKHKKKSSLEEAFPTTIIVRRKAMAT